jgi:hypothetical protein
MKEATWAVRKGEKTEYGPQAIAAKSRVPVKYRIRPMATAPLQKIAIMETGRRGA